MDTDRNLLFGVLALQADLIDSAQFAEGCATWASRKGTQLADILIERGWIEAADKADIERLMERKVKRHGGDLQATLDAVTDAGVREALATVEDAQIQKTILRLSSMTGHVIVDPLVRPGETKTRYTLSRLHGQGGLGRVWVARDNDLNREVALKELQADHAMTAEARSRFLKEAQITGQLEHPNIVPVYELGLRSDQRLFYTMRFLRGRTLRHAAAEYHRRRKEGQDDPLEFRRLLNVFMGVCHALAYAHSRGVVHRDVKPSNVVLGDFGEVVLLDWGLAKFVDSEDSDSKTLALTDAARVGETQAGRAIGTPAYMAPEQALGKLDHIGPHTDIYGLGASLFELLVGRAPHKGENTAETLERIVKETTPHAREAESSVPAALDAICARAMAKVPADRYGKAFDVADDVQRWLADEPVSCYRDPWSIRASRWARRHRTWAQAAAAALLAVTVVSVLAAFFVNLARQNEKRALTKAEKSLAAETAARAEATRYFKEARSAVDGYFKSVNDVLIHYDVLQEARVRLLVKAAAEYERFSHLESDNPELRAEFGGAFLRLGEIYQMLGELEKAENAFQSAAAFFESLVRFAPGKVAFIVQRANSRTSRAGVLRELGRNDKAEREYRATIAELVAPVGNSWSSDELQAALATCQVNLGLLLHAAGRHADAVGVIQEAMGKFQKLVASEPGREDSRFSLATANLLLGRIWIDQGQLRDADELFREAVESFEFLVRKNPKEPKFQQALADSRITIAELLRLQGKDREEGEAYQSAIVDYEALQKEYPDVPQYRENVALTRTDLGQLHAKSGQNRPAREQLDLAAKEFGDLVATQPRTIRFHEELAATRIARGHVLSDLGDHAAAEAELLAAIDTLDTLTRRFENPQYRQRLAAALGHLGQVLHKVNRREEAKEALDRSIDHYRQLLKSESGQPAIRDGLAWSTTHLGNLLHDMGQLEDAKATYQLVVETRANLVADLPEPEYLHNFAWFLVTVADAGVQDSGKAAELSSKALDQTPASATYWIGLGLALYRGEKYKGSIDAAHQAERLRAGGNSRDWFVLAMAYWKLGEKDKARSFMEKAVRWMEENSPANYELVRLRTEAESLIADR